MTSESADMVRVGSVFTIHTKGIVGYSNVINVKGSNDLFVYRMLDKTFFSVTHTPDSDKRNGVHNLICSMSPKSCNANYFALLLNSKHVQVTIESKHKENKRLGVPSIVSNIYVPVVEIEKQEAIGSLDVICQFLEMNAIEKVYTIEYPALKLGLFRELAEAIADEVYKTEQIKFFQLTFIHHWLLIYRSVNVEQYADGLKRELSEVGLLKCIEALFEKLVAPRSELYANLMRYRIVRSIND